MSSVFKKWITEFVILFAYKCIFEAVLLKKYMDIFTYLFVGVSYNPVREKWIFGLIAFAVLALTLIDSKFCRNRIYNVLLRFVFCICIIPMLSVYSCFEGIDKENIVYPFVFFVIFNLLLKHYSKKGEGEEKISLQVPYITGADYLLIAVCGMLALLIWVLAGHPVALNFDVAYERRMSLRMASLPTILNYLFMFIGGTAFPYLFARSISKKKLFRAFISLFFGIILFFVNGMKTWLLLYPLYIGIALLCKFSREDDRRLEILIDLLFLFLVLICVGLYSLTGRYDLMSQFARVTAIPSNIGFRSVKFFKENELLYLRESILRGIWKTPYKGGSDFYINYGADSTITSSRANNGLWGDAFRNFGAVGMLVYPVLIGGIFRIIEVNCREQKDELRVFVLFLALWSSINTSYFTWLLTGGVIVIVAMAKIDKAEKRLHLEELGLK